MLINLSNHPSSHWSELQLRCARAYGEIMDLPFPEIDPRAASREIDVLVEQYFARIMDFGSPTIMLQGEHVFTYRLVDKLKQAGLTVLAACSERQAVEEPGADGLMVKTSVFDFVAFREY